MMQRTYPHPELRMDRADFASISLKEGELLSVKVGHRAYFYAVRGGAGIMRLYGQDVGEIALQVGDVVVTSGFADHTLHAQSSAPDAAGLDLVQAHVPAEVIAFMPFKGGAMKLRASEDQSILRHIWRAVESILAEYEEDPAQLWSADIVRRLWEIVVINITRAIAQNRWLVPGALLDERVVRAIAAASKDLAHEWTVSEMAAEAGMSRTVFATRYRDMLNDTPLRGLTKMRIHHAAALLQYSNESVDNVARTVGYATATPFIRAFKREFGETPSQWRHKKGKAGSEAGHHSAVRD